MKTQVFTHTGWFGICPVYLANLEAEAVSMTPRKDDTLHEALFHITLWTFHAFFAVVDVLVPSWQPGYPIQVTGVLLVPYTYEYDDAQN